MGARFVVVGASLAGLRAVETARRLGHDGPVVLVGGEHHLPYDRPPLSKGVLDEKTDAGDPDTLVPAFRAREHLEDDLGVELLLGARATGLDTAARVLDVGGQEVPYDHLVVATGADARTLPGTGGFVNVTALRTRDEALAVRAALDAGARTVVVGAGFIGLEVASAARARGLPVTVVEALDVPLTRSLGPETGAVVADLHRARGVDLRTGTGVDRIESRGARATAVVLTDGTRLEADLVVVGVGVAPSTGWLSGSGVDLHARDGGVLCDALLRTSAPGVFAAGDVAWWPHPLLDDELVRLEHWTSAAEHGAAAATAALAPEKAAPVAGIPYFWSDQHDRRIQFVGSPAADEVHVVDDGAEGSRYLALYRRGDRVVGAFTVDRPTQIMKFRRLVGQRAPLDEALALASRLG